MKNIYIPVILCLIAAGCEQQQSAPAGSPEAVSAIRATLLAPPTESITIEESEQALSRVESPVPESEMTALIDDPILADPPNPLAAPVREKVAVAPAPAVRPDQPAPNVNEDRRLSRNDRPKWFEPASSQAEIPVLRTVPDETQSHADAIWIRTGEGYQQARHPISQLDAGCDVAVHGRIITGVLAPGGETTGTLIKTPDATWELYFGNKTTLHTQAQRLDGRLVVITGHARKYKGTHVPTRTIVTVEKLKAE